MGTLHIIGQTHRSDISQVNYGQLQARPVSVVFIMAFLIPQDLHKGLAITVCACQVILRLDLNVQSAF